MDGVLKRLVLIVVATSCCSSRAIDEYTSDSSLSSSLREDEFEVPASQSTGNASAETRTLKKEESTFFSVAEKPILKPFLVHSGYFSQPEQTSSFYEYEIPAAEEFVPAPGEEHLAAVAQQQPGLRTRMVQAIPGVQTAQKFKQVYDNLSEAAQHTTQAGKNVGLLTDKPAEEQSTGPSGTDALVAWSAGVKKQAKNLNTYTNKRSDEFQKIRQSGKNILTNLQNTGQHTSAALSKLNGVSQMAGTSEVSNQAPDDTLARVVKQLEETEAQTQRLASTAAELKQAAPRLHDKTVRIFSDIQASKNNVMGPPAEQGEQPALSLVEQVEGMVDSADAAVSRIRKESEGYPALKQQIDEVSPVVTDFFNRMGNAGNQLSDAFNKHAPAGEKKEELDAHQAAPEEQPETLVGQLAQNVKIFNDSVKQGSGYVDQFKDSTIGTVEKVGAVVYAPSTLQAHLKKNKARIIAGGVSLGVFVGGATVGGVVTHIVLDKQLQTMVKNYQARRAATLENDKTQQLFDRFSALMSDTGILPQESVVTLSALIQDTKQYLTRLATFEQSNKKDIETINKIVKKKRVGGIIGGAVGVGLAAGGLILAVHSGGSIAKSVQAHGAGDHDAARKEAIAGGLGTTGGVIAVGLGGVGAGSAASALISTAADNKLKTTMEDDFAIIKEERRLTRIMLAQFETEENRLKAAVRKATSREEIALSKQPSAGRKVLKKTNE